MVYDQYGITPDGQKFLVTKPIEESAKPLKVVLNWPAAVRAGAR
jgi:hypothetical protein